MKVGTDGILLGAWVNVKNTRSILDVGTGTGLIALMLAQRSQAQIDAVEIDEVASIQARENVQRSPWCDRIQVHHNSIQNYAMECTQKYDLLISNPPFFRNASRTLETTRNLARHDDSLSKSDLLQAGNQLLSEQGRLAVIYPPEEAITFQEKAEYLGFFCCRKIQIKTTQKGVIKRVAMEWGKERSSCEDSSLTIETDEHSYSSEFTALTKDFYLKL